MKARLRAVKPEFLPVQADTLPARLRRQRWRLGLSIEDAAAYVDVRRWTWGLWESGQQEPHRRHHAAIAEFLNEEA